MSMILSQSGAYEGNIELGLRLSRLSESEGGWSEMFAQTDEGDLRIDDPILRSQTAILLENAKRWIAHMCKGTRNESGNLEINEAVRSVLLGGFSDYLFPIIRASFPSNPLNDITAVQPTTRKNATIVHWNWIVGKGKGSYSQGQRLFDAQRGKQDIGFNFSNDVVDYEALGAGDGANAQFAGTLKFHDGGGVRPGTVKITTTVGASEVVVTDNGNGGWTGGLSGSIDYLTGIYTITFGGNVDASASIVGTYRWDTEGSNMVPEVDVQVTTSTIETERRALKMNYSLESMYDVMQEFGVALEPSLLQGASEQLNYEIARQVIHEMWMVANVVATFNIATPGGYNQQDHFKDIVFTLNTASNKINSATQKGYGNVIIADEMACNVIESLPDPLFQAASVPDNVQGLHYIGTLNKKFRVYKDLFLYKEAGASAHGNMLMLFKGRQFFEAAAVWSPYQLFYTTDTLTTADMMSQKGMASRSAFRVINADMVVRINLSNIPA